MRPSPNLPLNCNNYEKLCSISYAKLVANDKIRNNCKLFQKDFHDYKNIYRKGTSLFISVSLYMFAGEFIRTCMVLWSGRAEL